MRHAVYHGIMETAMRFLLGGTEFETRSMLVFFCERASLCAHALMKVMRPRSKELCFASVHGGPTYAAERLRALRDCRVSDPR